MGCYVNPHGQDKESWLFEHGHETNQPVITAEELPVCLVNNGPFTAAGVAFNHGELDAFSRPDDPRPKMWFMVSREKLRTVSDLASWEK